MAQHVKIWYDREGDFLEVLFSEAPGYMRETGNDAVMERVDASGNLLGFSVMNVSAALGRISTREWLRKTSRNSSRCIVRPEATFQESQWNARRLTNTDARYRAATRNVLLTTSPLTMDEVYARIPPTCLSMIWRL